MTIVEFVKKKVLKMLGLAQYDTAPDTDRLTFINNQDEIVRMKLKEYNVWYGGDGDELLNYYTRADMIDYNFEPFYMRNKKNYFWAIGAREAQIKRTHSGQPRNIVDTLVAIMPFPIITAGALESSSETNNAVQRNLDNILRDSELEEKYRNEQMPLSLVEGWGCWKINWNKDISDYPAAIYYRAENVDFVYKGGRITGVIFKDYYTNNEKKYMLVETRRIEYRATENVRVLVIEKELFRLSSMGVTSGDDSIVKVDLKTVPELEDIQDYIEIGPFDQLLAVPVVHFGNTAQEGGYGRSIFAGKIDLFDDLDQTLSQASNAVRLSTPIEYFNSEFLERDKTGLPKRPVSYDRKYIMVEGQKNADGVSVGQPIQVTQPQLNFEGYSTHAVQILLQIINGIMSPATLGIDIAKKDNAEAQREKEKVTIFTRNTIISSQIKIFKKLCSQLLVAYEFMNKGVITVQNYDISVKYNEFADDSFENKLEKLGNALDTDNISEEMYMQKLYGNTLSRADFNKELNWLKERHQASADAKNEGMAGAGGGGQNPLAAMMGGPDEDEEDGLF